LTQLVNGMLHWQIRTYWSVTKSLKALFSVYIQAVMFACSGGKIGKYRRRLASKYANHVFM